MYLKNYNTGSITASAGSESHETSFKIRGEIHSIKFDYQDTTNTGSIFVKTNTGVEPEETILFDKSFAADIIFYPRAIVQKYDGTDAAAGDNLWDYFRVNSTLKVWIEGGGAGKYVKNVTITYI